MTQIADQNRRYLFKVVVVGDGGIGKSTMIQRLITGRFVPMKITIGTDLATKELDINENKIKLQVWDFAGEKRFRFFLPNYSRGAKGCLLCYDISRYSSFQSLPEWYEIIKQNAGEPIFILVGCKQDLAELKRTVSVEEAKEFQKQYMIPYFFETSSKTGYQNEKIFEIMSRNLYEKISRI
ncbi:MAG: Rab family GTPase [Promethearchaeota archaeon]